MLLCIWYMMVGDCWLECIKDCCKGRSAVVSNGQSAASSLCCECSRQTIMETLECAAPEMYINRYSVRTTAYLFVSDIPTTRSFLKVLSGNP
jgi:hypothetical protein